MLNDIDAALVCRAREAPSDSVVTSCAASWLKQAAVDRKARVVHVQQRYHARDLIAIEQLGIDARHYMALPRLAATSRWLSE